MYEETGRHSLFCAAERCRKEKDRFTVIKRDVPVCQATDIFITSGRILKRRTTLTLCDQHDTPTA